jgi:hypothetical protein
LKAVTMGMVTAITFFWSNKPNPAIAQWILHDLKAGPRPTGIRGGGGGGLCFLLPFDFIG